MYVLSYRRDYFKFHGGCFASLLCNAMQKIRGAIGVLEYFKSSGNTYVCMSLSIVYVCMYACMYLLCLKGTPRDSYGIPYTIPLGMSSLEIYAGFPVYAGKHSRIHTYIHAYIHILKLLYGDRNASFIWQQEVEGS